MFEFPDGVETVTVQAEASSSRCAILSVQNVSVSRNDSATSVYTLRLPL